MGLLNTAALPFSRAGCPTSTALEIGVNAATVIRLKVQLAAQLAGQSGGDLQAHGGRISGLQARRQADTVVSYCQMGGAVVPMNVDLDCPFAAVTEAVLERVAD